jgi:hypothetical protein
LDNVKKLFVQALIEAESKEISKLKGEDEIEWEFSEKFENSMNKLIRKNNHIRLSTRRTVRRGLLAAIIALIAVFSGLMSVSATREPIVNFVKRVFSDHNEMTMSRNSVLPVDRIETEYTLYDLPEEYELTTYEKDEIGVFSRWKSSVDNSEIVFSQDILLVNMSIDNEHNYRETVVNGYTAYLNQYEFNTSLTWTDGTYLFTLNVPNSLNIDITDLAKNIIEKN